MMGWMDFLISVIGRKATDKVTNASGVITAVNFDLYGCVQAVLTPAAGEDGKQIAGEWFDVKRLVISKDAPVMQCPDFIVGPLDEMPDRGGAQKPLP